MAYTQPTPDHLFSLIDAYAAARSHRDIAYQECAAWAFADAHRAMTAARNSIAHVLDIPRGILPEPVDALAAAARRVIDDDERWRARIDRALHSRCSSDTVVTPNSTDRANDEQGAVR